MQIYRQPSKRGIGIGSVVLSVLVLFLIPYAPMPICIGFTSLLLLLGGLLMIFNQPTLTITDEHLVLDGNIFKNQNKTYKWSDIDRIAIKPFANNQKVLRLFGKESPDQLLGAIGGVQGYPEWSEIQKDIEDKLGKPIEHSDQ